MARKTSYMGYTAGAVAVELRRGSVNYLALGTVDRFTPEEQAINGGCLYKFRETRRLTGVAAKALAARLAEVSRQWARGELTSEQRMAATDAMIVA